MAFWDESLEEEVKAAGEFSPHADFGKAGDPVVPPATPDVRASTIARKPPLVFGMLREPDVGVLQDLLIEKNTGPHAVDLANRLAQDPTDRGDFGNRTKLAVIEYQSGPEGKAAGLGADGQVALYTWNALVGTPVPPGSIPKGQNPIPKVQPPSVPGPGPAPKPGTPGKPGVVKPGPGKIPVNEAGMLGAIPKWLMYAGGAALAVFGYKKLTEKKHHGGH